MKQNRTPPKSPEWLRDYAIIHQWEERWSLNLGVLVCYVQRDYTDHDVFTARVTGRSARQLVRKFATADEAKRASLVLARKVCAQLTQAVTEAMRSADQPPAVKPITE